MSSHQRSHIHQALRHATAAAHHALDHHPLMQRLTGSDLTRERYAESLAAMYLPHVRLERLVRESNHHFESAFKLSARIDLLEADLSQMHWPVPLVPQVPQVPTDPPEGRATWWGRVYVLEGSRLGGAIIARCIQASLGDSVPCRFFSGAPAPDGRSTLLAMLERALEGHDDLEQAVASARAAFAAYKTGLDGFDCGKRGMEMR